MKLHHAKPKYHLKEVTWQQVELEKLNIHFGSQDIKWLKC
jgi:hypothetical protein